jgi:broad specificity phosphatase PhoE
LNFNLDVVGEQQMRNLSGLLRNLRPKAVFSSSLERAIRSAELVATGAHHVVDSRLNEYDYGHWTGRTQAEVERSYPNELRGLMTYDADVPMKDGEPVSRLFARVSEALREQIALASVEPGTVVVVAHDLVIRVAISILLGVDRREYWKFPVLNGGVSAVERHPNGHWQLTSHNSLPGPLVDRHDNEYF